jgi:hypothetical protein
MERNYYVVRVGLGQNVWDYTQMGVVTVGWSALVTKETTLKGKGGTGIWLS